MSDITIICSSLAKKKKNHYRCTGTLQALNNNQTVPGYFSHSEHSEHSENSKHSEHSEHFPRYWAILLYSFLFLFVGFLVELFFRGLDRTSFLREKLSVRSRHYFILILQLLLILFVASTLIFYFSHRVSQAETILFALKCLGFHRQFFPNDLRLDGNNSKIPFSKAQDLENLNRRGRFQENRNQEW